MSSTRSSVTRRRLAGSAAGDSSAMARAACSATVAAGVAGISDPAFLALPQPGFGDDEIHGDIVRLRMDGVEQRRLEADADGDGLRLERRQRAVEIAAAIAEPVIRRVEADQRHDDDVGPHHIARLGRGYVVEAALHLRVPVPGAVLERAVALDDGGEREGP